MAAPIASGAIPIEFVTTDYLDEYGYIVDGKFDWQQLANDPNGFAAVIQDIGAPEPRLFVNLDDGEDNQIDAWEWTTGLRLTAPIDTSIHAEVATLPVRATR